MSDPQLFLEGVAFGEPPRWHDGLAQAGIAITSDERTLIVAEPYAERLTAFEIDDDRGLRARRVCAEP